MQSRRGKGSSSPRDGCLKCGGAHFQRDCNVRKGTGKQSYGKGKQSKSWSQSEPSHSGKGESKDNTGKSKGKSKGTKSANQGAKGVHKGETSKAGFSDLENSKSETSSEAQLHRHVPWTLLGMMVASVMNGTMAGVSMSGLTGVLLDGTKVGNKRMIFSQAHYHLEV